MTNITKYVAAIKPPAAQPFMVRINPTDYQRLEKAARMLNTKKATLARAIISEWLDHNEPAKPKKA